MCVFFYSDLISKIEQNFHILIQCVSWQRLHQVEKPEKKRGGKSQTDPLLEFCSGAKENS